MVSLKGGLGKLKGAFGVGSIAAGVAEGAAESYVTRTVDQAINIAVGRIDIRQIIKYCVYFAIILGLALISINAIRGILIEIEYQTCGLSNTGCDWLGGSCAECDPNAMDTTIRSIAWAWQIEWTLLCLLYLSIAIPVGLLLYQYSKYLADKLLRAEYYIRMIENWIYGFGWEGAAEKQIETRI